MAQSFFIGVAAVLMLAVFGIDIASMNSTPPSVTVQGVP
jgi:hypothetical protein